VNLNALWLAVLLFGSLLAAGAWLGWLSTRQLDGEEGEIPARIQGPRDLLSTPLLLLVCVLVLAQSVLFFASGRIAEALAAWATVPWTLGP
jgi:hypothetical protein